MEVKNYKTMPLLEGQKFKLNGNSYQITSKHFFGRFKEFWRIGYVFKRLPDTNGDRWKMSHERLEGLELENKIEFY